MAKSNCERASSRKSLSGGWTLWFGFLILIFSGIGNWGYTYNAHRKYGQSPTKGALEVPNERYAQGEITRKQFAQLKADILAPQEVQRSHGAKQNVERCAEVGKPPSARRPIQKQR